MKRLAVVVILLLIPVVLEAQVKMGPLEGYPLCDGARWAGLEVVLPPDAKPGGTLTITWPPIDPCAGRSRQPSGRSSSPSI